MTSAQPTPGRRSDPERGFRGVMSGALILQSITVLLGLPVVSNDHELRAWELIVILALALVLILACTQVKKPFAVPLIIGLQVVAVACWFIYPALGVMGLIFGVAWWTLLHFRSEYRRRLAEGSLPGQRPETGDVG